MLKRVMLIIGVLLLLLVFAGTFVLPRFAFPLLSQEITRRTGYRVTAEAVGFDWRKGISLSRVVVLDPQGQQAAFAKRFYVDPHWKALLERRLELNKVSVEFPQGTIEGDVKVAFEEGTDFQIVLRTERFLVQVGSAPPRYVSGAVDCSGDLKTLREINARGTLEVRDKPSRGRPTGTVRVNLVKGRGEVVAQLNDPLLVSATAQLELDREKIAARFHTGAYRKMQRLEGRVSGSFSSWDVNAQMLLPQDVSVRYAGPVQKTKTGWRVGWDSLVLHPPKGTDWRTPRPGYALISSGTVEVPEFALTDGTNNARLTQGRYSEQSLYGRLRADLALRFLADSVPGLEIDPGSQVKADLVFSGRPQQMKIQGQLTGNIPRLVYKEAGVDLRDVNANLETQGSEMVVRTFTGKLGKGEWNVTGTAWPNVDLRLAADNVTFDIPKELDLKTDAAFHLAGVARALELTGEVKPQSGTYTVIKKKKEKKPKETAEETPEEKAAAASDIWKGLKVEVTAEWTHNLWYRDGLTKIDTGGDLRLTKARSVDQVKLTGAISLVRGHYDAYGKDFKIESGEIVFTGEAITNPRLNIRAEYRTNQWTINLLVLGTAEHPDLRFTSSPPLSRQEILSVLVTGQPTSTLGSSEEGSKELAAEVASNYLTQTLRSSGLNLGLDVVRVTPTPTGTIWTVGRYVGPDLFVSYGQNPKDSASSVVNAEYFLTRRWSISTQASSASDNYVDFLFRYPLKKRSDR